MCNFECVMSGFVFNILLVEIFQRLLNLLNDLPACASWAIFLSITGFIQVESSLLFQIVMDDCLYATPYTPYTTRKWKKKMKIKMKIKKNWGSFEDYFFKWRQFVNRNVRCFSSYLKCLNCVHEIYFANLFHDGSNSGSSSLSHGEPRSGKKN